MDQLTRLGKRELICLLLFTCNYVVSVQRGILFLWELGMGYAVLLWHFLSLPYNSFLYFRNFTPKFKFLVPLRLTTRNMQCFYVTHFQPFNIRLKPVCNRYEKFWTQQSLLKIMHFSVNKQQHSLYYQRTRTGPSSM